MVLDMYSLEIKEEDIVDEVKNHSSQDEYTYEPINVGCLDSALAESCNVLIESSIGAEKYGGLEDVEQDPLNVNPKSIELPSVRDEEVELDKLSQMSASFGVFKGEEGVVDSERTIVKVEPTMLQDDEAINTNKMELTSSENVVAIQDIKSTLSHFNSDMPEIDILIPAKKADSVASQLKLEILSSAKITSKEMVMPSEKTIIKEEPIILQGDEVSNPIKMELISSENIFAFPGIKISNLKNSDLPKNELSTSAKKSNSVVSQLKLEVLTSSQAKERYIGPRTRKKVSSSTSHKTVEGSQDIVNKYNLKPVTVNVGPRVYLPHCFLPSLKLTIYSCSKCSSKFTDSSAYDAHVKLCTTSKIKGLKNSLRSYHCEICTFKFKEITNLHNHMIKHVDMNFSCNICALEFLTADKLRVHGNMTHKDKSSLKMLYACNVCNYSTSNHSHFKEHLLRHTPDKHLYCYRCRRNYEDESDYEKHWGKLHDNVLRKKRRRIEPEQGSTKTGIYVMNSVQDSGNIDKCTSNKHKEPTDRGAKPVVPCTKLDNFRSSWESEIKLKDGMYHCSVCIYKFHKLDNLKVHMDLHFETGRPYKCYQCKYESFSVLQMENHCKQLSHSKISQCDVCSFEASRWDSMKRHAINHIYDGLFCRQCFLNFENYELCKEHMLKRHHIASLEDLFSCDECSYTHPSETSYHKHYGTNHLNKKNPPAVKLCEMPFKTKSGLNIKNANAHEQGGTRILQRQTTSVVQKSKDCKPKKSSYLPITSAGATSKISYSYSCAKCEFTTKYQKSFIAHHDRKHATSEKLYECNICCKKLALLKHYLKHIKSHDGVLIYECPFCNYSSDKEVEFVKHAMNHELYKCPMCVYKTRNLRLFDNHIVKQHKRSPGAFACPLCPYCTKEQQQLSLHCLRFHPTNYLKMKLPIPTSLSLRDKNDVFVGCKLCKFTCKKLKIYDLKRHLIRHFADGSINKFTSVRLGSKRLKNTTVSLKETPKIKKSQLQNRRKGAFCSKPPNRSFYYSCSKCNMTSLYIKNISKHVKSVHKSNGGIQKKFIHKISRNSTRVKEKRNHSKDDSVKLEPVDLPMQNSEDAGKFYNISRNTLRVKEEAVDCKDYFTAQPETVDIPIQNLEDIRSGDKSKTKYFISYQCSKCDFKRHKRVAVYKHLYNVHKITGGLKGNKIFKVVENIPQPPQENATIHSSIKNRFKTIKKSPANPKGKSACLSKQHNPLLENLRVTKASLKHDLFYPCLQCCFKSKNKNALKLHLRQHKKVRVPKNNKISAVINDQSRNHSYGKPSWNTTPNDQISKTYPFEDSILTGSKIEKQLTTNDHFLQEKPVSVSIDSGSTIYLCILCNNSFKSNSRKSLNEHLLTFHKVENEQMRKSWIQKGTLMVNVLQKVKKCDISVKKGAGNQAKIQVKNNNKAPSKCLPLYRNTNDSFSSFVKSKNSRRFLTNNSASLEDDLQSGKTKCHLCNIHTFSNYAQINHKSIGHEKFWKKPYVCKVVNCGVRFTDFSSLKRHETKHTMQVYFCQICNKFFTYRKDSLKKHQSSCSKKKESIRQIILSGRKIAVAKPRLSSRDNYDEEHYCCGECDYETRDKNLFLNHMDTHAGIDDC